MDRVKESLFNILGADVVGTRWLDLFAGTGQVGIEALSRGAREVVFVDTAYAAIRVVKENLRTTALTAAARVLQMDAFAFLQQPQGAPFDVIYVAPPQYLGLWLKVMTVLGERPLTYLVPSGIVIVQIDPREHAELSESPFALYDWRKYGNTQLNFYRLL